MRRTGNGLHLAEQRFTKDIHQGVQDNTAIVTLLKECIRRKDTLRGSSIYTEILKTGVLEHDISVATSLIQLYAQCNEFAKAKQFFDDLPVRDVECWNALIIEYLQHGHAWEVIGWFQQMQHEGIFPNTVSFMHILKACGNTNSVERGREVHAEVVMEGMHNLLGNAVVEMYAKCGELVEAHDVFDELLTQDVVSWTVLISGYGNHGQAQKALHCFGRMQAEGFSPNEVTYACVVKACGSMKATEKGKQIHATIVEKKMLQKSFYLSTALVDMYCKCGIFGKAHEVFDELLDRDVVCWTTLITGYAQYGLGNKALNCFEQMLNEGLLPNPVTFLCVVNVCSSTQAIDKGKQIHAEILRRRMLGKNLSLCIALANMYAKCGVFSKAQELLDESPVRTVASWNVLIAGYVQHGLNKEALDCFEKMHCKGFCADSITLVSVLKACANMGVVTKGAELHAEILREGMLEKNVSLGTALVDMYAKCGKLAQAQEVFDRLSLRDTVSWNALIAGYTQHGHGKEALFCYEKMQMEGFAADSVTYASVVKACGSIGAIEKGNEVIYEILKAGRLDNDAVLGNTLIDMYAKCGALGKAQKLFDKMCVRDLVSWNSLISGYAQHGHGENALDCFEWMQKDRFSPDSVTFISIAKACGSIGSVEMGLELHNHIVKKGMLDERNLLGTAFVDMYAKCGSISNAQQMFDMLHVQDVFSWTALISGYAELGYSYSVFELVSKMLENNVMPDVPTVTAVLNMCSHSGLVDEGPMYLSAMKKCGIGPTLDHYTCIVDLFSRAGQLEKAIAVIRQLETNDNFLPWSALLGACQKWQNLDIGKVAFHHAESLDGQPVAAFVCLSNIYATVEECRSYTSNQPFVA